MHVIHFHVIIKVDKALCCICAGALVCMNALKDDGTIKLSVGVQCSWLFLLCLESVPVETWCLEQEDKRRECV